MPSSKRNVLLSGILLLAIFPAYAASRHIHYILPGGPTVIPPATPQANIVRVP